MAKQKFEAELGLNTKDFENGLRDANNGFSGLGKHIAAITTAVSIAGTAFSILTDWFRKTEQGADFMNSTLRVSRQLLTDIISGQKSNLAETIKLAKQENDIRFGNYKDAVRIAELERDIRKYRLESVDESKSLQDRYNSITKALEKQRELEAYKKADIKEELDVVKQLLQKDITNADLWKRYTDLKVQFLNADESESLRIIQFRNSLLHQMKQRAEDLVDAFTPVEEVIKDAGKAVDELNTGLGRLSLNISSFADWASNQNFTAVGGVSQILGEQSVYNARLAGFSENNLPKLKEVTKEYRLQYEAVNMLSDSLYEMFKGTEDWGKNMVNTLIEALTRFITKAIAAMAIQGVINLISNLRQGYGFSFSSLGSGTSVLGSIGLASGGLAYGPTLAMVGEYGGASSNPEVIAPLNKLMQYMGGGNNINVTVEGRIRGRDLDLVQRRYGVGG